MVKCPACDKDLDVGKSFCNDEHEIIVEISTLLKQLKETGNVSLTYKINDLERSIGREPTDFTNDTCKDKFGL